MNARKFFVLRKRRLNHTVCMVGMAYKTWMHVSATTDDTILSTILSLGCINTKTRKLWGG